MKKLIGDKAFYFMVLSIAIPIIVQNGVTNFVGLLDNVMIGQIGTLPMSGVSIANQLLQIFNVTIFGAMSGPGIFSAQFFGKKDNKGVQQCFRFKLLIGIMILLLAIYIFYFHGTYFINLYLLNENNNVNDMTLTLNYSYSYLKIMLIGLLPFVLSQIYSSTLREGGETLLPMISSITAVFVNFVFNYLFIFGAFYFPKLGIIGAAIATVMSRYIEFMILCIGSHYKHYNYLKGLYKDFMIELSLMKLMIIKGAPLLFNEILWSISMALINQCYSTRGITAVAAINITTTVTSVFMIVCYAMGNSISIIVGQQLGAGNNDIAYEYDLKLITFNFFLCICTGLLLFSCSSLIPNFYNTTLEVKTLAISLLRIASLFMPIISLYYSSYFTLRAGGNTILTFMFDSVYSFMISFSIAFILSRFTNFNIILMYFIIQSIDIVKVILGLRLVVRKKWIHNIINDV
jgi:putative MATE family efflux protein